MEAAEARIGIAQEQLGAVEANLETTRETVRLTQLRLDKGLQQHVDLDFGSPRVDMQ